MRREPCDEQYLPPDAPRLSTTMRYMHLAEGHEELTIRLLDRRPVLAPQGGRVEAGVEALKG